MLNLAAMLKSLLQNRWADIPETWYVASGTLAHHSLFKSKPKDDHDLFYNKVNFGSWLLHAKK